MTFCVMLLLEHSPQREPGGRGRREVMGRVSLSEEPGTRASGMGSALGKTGHWKRPAHESQQTWLLERPTWRLHMGKQA